MKLTATIFILAVALLFNCTNSEEPFPLTSLVADNNTLLGVIETPEGHHVSFHELSPGNIGTLAAYYSNDDFSVEIQTLIGSGLPATEVYKRLAKNDINKQYLENIRAAESRKPKGAEVTEKLQQQKIETGSQRTSVAFTLAPWCPFPIQYVQTKCKVVNGLTTWYPQVKNNFRVRLHIYPETGGGYLRVDRRNCGFEYCDPGVPVFDLVKFNNGTEAVYIEYISPNQVTPDSYYFRGEGFASATKSASKVHMGVGVDKTGF